MKVIAWLKSEPKTKKSDVVALSRKVRKKIGVKIGDVVEISACGRRFLCVVKDLESESEAVRVSSSLFKILGVKEGCIASIRKVRLKPAERVTIEVVDGLHIISLQILKYIKRSLVGRPVAKNSILIIENPFTGGEIVLKVTDTKPNYSIITSLTHVNYYKPVFYKPT